MTGNEIERTTTEAVGALVAGLLGLAVAGPGGALLAAGATPYATAWVRRCWEEWHHRGVTMAEAAAAAAKLSQDEVVRQALEDEGLDPLVREILQAAERTDQIAALRVLGAILGDRTAHGAPRIDEDVMIARAIADLRAPHIEVMNLLDSEPPENAWDLNSIVNELSDRMPLLGPKAALGSLTGSGLVTVISGFGALVYELSPLGKYLLDAISLAGGWAPR